MEPGEVRITVRAEHAREIRQIVRRIERGEYPRPEIMEFAEAMENTMRKHDPEKGDSWKEMTPLKLYALLADEHRELKEVFIVGTPGKDPLDAIALECLDLANVSMMLYHRARMMRKEVTE